MNTTTLRVFGWTVLIVSMAILTVSGQMESEESPIEDNPVTVSEPFPVGEKLGYSVSWMGVRCGRMVITSFVEDGTGGGPVYRIALFARTSKFFDGVYRVRSRLDSFFDPGGMTSIRYEEHGREKKKQKEDVWDFDFVSHELVRIKNGTTTRMPIDVERALDPLAFVYRLRGMEAAVGDEMTLVLMTSKGPMETIVRATEAKSVRTGLGKCNAISVVPEPRDKMMFSKSGAMRIWIDQEEPRRPCRIEFDLSFGKLVAKLVTVEVAEGATVEEDWEKWQN